MQMSARANCHVTTARGKRFRFEQVLSVVKVPQQKHLLCYWVPATTASILSVTAEASSSTLDCGRWAQGQAAAAMMPQSHDGCAGYRRVRRPGGRLEGIGRKLSLGAHWIIY